LPAAATNLIVFPASHVPDEIASCANFGVFIDNTTAEQFRTERGDDE
jgi:hypothetical protein